MQTRLHPDLAGSEAARQAEALLRACVHCGFCNATCPTYLLQGDEADGPRGRIWLMADLLEHDAANETHRTHLDRCLTCRACETTCPSGVRYGELLELARPLVEERAGRGLRERLLRWLLLTFVPHRRRLRFALRLARLCRPLLPPTWAAQLPSEHRPPAAPEVSAAAATDAVVLLDGCVQSAATPGVNAALRRVLARFGVRTITLANEACCGALAHHLGDEAAAAAPMRRNVQQASQALAQGASGVLSSASGCGVQWKDYGRLLQNTDLAEAAAAVADSVRDAGEFLSSRWDEAAVAALGPPPAELPRRIAFQIPCTLQHGQRAEAAVERLLRHAGAELVDVPEAHLCCGSAGTYSLLQPELAVRLREQKLATLMADGPEAIVTANVGCQLWLRAADVPVMHWIEWLDRRLGGAENGGGGAP